MKFCTKCKNIKDVAEFRNDKTGRKGLRSMCKECEKQNRQILNKKRSRDALQNNQSNIQQNNIQSNNQSNIQPSNLVKECKKCKLNKMVKDFKKNSSTCQTCLQINEREKRSLTRNNKSILNGLQMITNDSGFKKVNSALDNFFTEYKLDLKEINDFKDAKNRLIHQLNEFVIQFPIKARVSLEYTMINKRNMSFNMNISTDKRDVLENNIDKIAEILILELLDKIHNSNYEESGLTLGKIKNII